LPGLDCADKPSGAKTSAAKTSAAKTSAAGVEDRSPLRMTQIDGPGKDSSFGKLRLGVAP
jgi:hypothetical protein